MSKQPENTFQDGVLKASVWRNESENGVYHSTKLSRSYQDQSGNWKETSNFSQTDLLKVAELARKAYSYINDVKREHSQSRDMSQAQKAFHDKRQAGGQTQRNNSHDR